MSQPTGILLMAYGTPRDLSEIEPYYRSIRGGRAPTSEAVRHLTERYRKVGGSTPLLEITGQVAAALEKRLNEHMGSSYRVYIGMKHWRPFIQETVSQMATDGVQRLIAIPLTPHYSEMSVDGYRSAVEEAMRVLPRPIPTRFIESWHANPMFISMLAWKVKEGLKGFHQSSATDVEVLFSAHSLPQSILRRNDPYPRELRESCESVVKSTGLSSWRFAYQSAARTPDPWLGPDILETIRSLAGQGKKHVLVVPIGFVSDHLEILYDIDVVARDLATELGLELRRTEMPNTSQAFIETLADLVVNGTGARMSDLK